MSVEILFAGLVGVLLVAAILWLARPDFAFDSSLAVITLAWAYYTFAIPLDLWLGFSVRGSQRLPDLEDPGMFGYVIDVFLYHVAFMAGVLIGHRGMQILRRTSARPATPGDVGFPSWLATPAVLPDWCAYVVAGLAVTVYWTIFDTANRGLQEESLRQD